MSGKLKLRQRLFFLKQEAILHKPFFIRTSEFLLTLLQLIIETHFTKSTEKGTYFKTPQTTNISIKSTSLLQTTLNCNVFALKNKYFFISHRTKESFSDFLGVRVNTKLHHNCTLILLKVQNSTPVT